MKKNGFVFVESVIVLVVVALSLAMLISSYSLVKRKTQETEYYDKASDKYLLYSISNLGTDDICNYSKDCGSKITGVSANTYRNSSTNISFRADADDSAGFNCTKSKVGKIMYNCNDVFDKLNIVHLYVVENIVDELNGANDVSGGYKTVSFYDSGTIEYMKSIKKCNDLDFNKNTTKCNSPITYLIGVFERGNNEFYYASIELAAIDASQSSQTMSDGWYWYNRGANVDIDQQIWYYYTDNKPIKGLHKLATGSDGEVSYYYYFGNDGIMKLGWIYYDGAYHLFSPGEFGTAIDGTVDGRRIQSCKDTRLKITVNDNKDFYLDRTGACYTCASGDCKCNENDVSDRILDITIDAHEYRCNGDEYN